MDPKNEKIVFNMIVDMLSSDNDLAKTQYFILTPKLVPDLKFNQKTKIHCIYSGGKLDKRKSWNVTDFLKSMSNQQMVTEMEAI
ncbi:unnamed protein product [Brugia pahangi]|uniref:Uncharacterized protein n=1 Tax=Brugia pahangi TaxID=6280 RepID=A0A0N4TAH4_BRUPA|nr:unnamed protein product [Brugia pahangi]